MKKIVEMATYFCNCCGKQLIDGDGITGYTDKVIFEAIGFENGWIEHERKHKHYCPDCYEINDDENVIIKEYEPKKDKW